MHYEDFSIMVVDDDATNRAILGGCLLKEGYSVAEAENGEEALALTQIETFDLILLDIEMPGLDGYGVLEKLRSNEKTKRVHVMMTTGIKEAGAVTRCVKLGAEEYFVKPYDLNSVRTRVWRCLTRQPVPKPAANVSMPARTAAPRIGLLDPDSLAQTREKRALEAGGCKVTILTGEGDAVGAVETKLIDGVVMDATHVGIDGFEILEKLKKLERKVPVIVVSSSPDPEKIKRCISAGASEFVARPFHAGTLRAHVLAGLVSEKRAKTG